LLSIIILKGIESMRKPADQNQTPVKRVASYELKRQDFVKRTSSYSKHTENVYISDNWDYSGVSSVEENVRLNFPAIMELLQNNIDSALENALCKKNQFLLIYNFQPVTTTKKGKYYSIDILVKPIEHTQDLGTKSQENKYLKLSLVVSPSGEVINEFLFLQQEFPEDSLEEKQVPISYGFYHLYIEKTVKIRLEKVKYEPSQEVDTDGVTTLLYKLHLNNNSPQKDNEQQTPLTNPNPNTSNKSSLLS